MKIFPALMVLFPIGFLAPLALAAPASKPVVKPVAKTQAQSTQQMVNRVLKETSLIRGLSILRAVPSGVQSSVGIEKMIETALQNQLPSDAEIATEIFLKQLALAPAGFDLKKYYVRMMGEQIAGYYCSNRVVS